MENDESKRNAYLDTVEREHSDYEDIIAELISAALVSFSTVDDRLTPEEFRKWLFDDLI